MKHVSKSWCVFHKMQTVTTEERQLFIQWRETEAWIYYLICGSESTTHWLCDVGPGS